MQLCRLTVAAQFIVVVVVVVVVGLAIAIAVVPFSSPTLGASSSSERGWSGRI